MKINMEFGVSHYEKLQYLQRVAGKDIRTLLETAIDCLYARHIRGSDTLNILRKNGFIGCLKDTSNLSEDYKQKLDWNDKL
jgi:hypothetical protein